MKRIQIGLVTMVEFMIPYSSKVGDRFHVILKGAEMAKIIIIVWRARFKIINDVTCVQDGVRLIITDHLGELVLKKVSTARVAKQHQLDGASGL